MRRRPPRSTRTDTLLPDTPLFRSPANRPVTLPPLIEAMRRPEFYPHEPAAVALVQTHISYVFLAGAEVYKVKKPVRFTFLDFSTLPRRRQDRKSTRLNSSHYCASRMPPSA